MQITVSSTIKTTPENVFRLLCRGEAIVELSKGFPISYDDTDIPTLWQVGQPVNIRPKFACFPRRDLFVTFTHFDAEQHLIQTSECGTGISKWDHRMETRPLPHGYCRHTDTVTIEAGFLTPIMCLLAWRLYRHRQKRLATLLEE